MTKTIRFKLTLWYSLLLVVTCGLLLLLLNIVFTNYYLQSPQHLPVPMMLRNNRRVNGNPINPIDEEREELIKEYRLQDLDKIRQTSMLALIPLTLISFGSGYLIAGQMLKPISHLNKATKQITAQNLQSKIEFVDNGDELSELTNNFNQMITRLQHSFDLQMQFIENASHELKTPLAIIRTNLESVLLDAHKLKADQSDSLNTSIKSTKLADKLLEDLLLLALTDEQISMSRIDLAVVLHDSVEQLRTLSAKKNITLTHELELEQSELKGNSALLQRAIMNIIENAIYHAPKSSQVIISATQIDNLYKITIKDEGPGIPREEQEKIFERFYRVDKSRSRSSGGSGLGLAITKKIVELHHGNISLNTKVTSGSEFIIEIPAR